MARKPIYMETTEVPADRTAAEITSCLVQAGASSINTKYEGGKIVGLAWAVKFGPREIHFAMPARVEPVYKLLHGRRDKWQAYKYEQADRAQAERVAWRQLLRWVQAQLAMIEVGMVKHHEVFLPYLQRDDGQTLFEHFESQQLALPAAGKPQ